MIEGGVPIPCVRMSTHPAGHLPGIQVWWRSKGPTIRVKINEVTGNASARVGLALAQPGWPPKNFYLIGLESDFNASKAHAVIGVQKGEKWTPITSPDFETPIGEWIEILVKASTSNNIIQIYYNNQHLTTLNNLEILGPWQIAIARNGYIRAYIDDRELFAKIWNTYPQQLH